MELYDNEFKFWNNFEVYVPSLEKLPQQFKIVLSRIQCNENITNYDLEHVSKFIKLQQLNLCGCKRITGNGLRHLIKLKSLQQLNLKRCKFITYIDLQHLKLTSL